MTRRELRTCAFKLLYRTFFYSEEEMKEQEDLFLSDPEMMVEEKDAEYIKKRVSEVMKRIPQIDEAIDAKAESWKVNRINYVELTILRQAYFEIYFDEDIPMAVAINEAVELAKIYGGEESASFVNGVLAKLL